MTRFGCDPELLLWRGEVYDAPGHASPAGNVPGGIFGIDGAGEAAELRPAPADTVEEAVNNIAACFKHGMETSNVANFAWSGGTGKTYHPIGGHLHLACPDSLNTLRSGVHERFARLLDTYLGIPLLALEPGRARIGRREHGYGKWCDYRDAEWGDGIEYRTTSSWLISPVLTKMAFALSAMVMDHPDPTSLRFASLSGTRDMTRTRVLRREARRALREMATWPHYPRYAKYIEPWHIYDKVLGTWVEERDMRQTWKLLPQGEGIPPPPAPIGDASYRQTLLDGGSWMIPYRRAAEGTTSYLTRLEEFSIPRSLCLQIIGQPSRYLPTSLVEQHSGSSKSDLQWNRSHLGLKDMAKSIGPKVSATGQTLWITGANARRGNKFRLSPALAALPTLRTALRDADIRYEKWTPFPEKMGGYVVAVPMGLRRESPGQATEIVTKIVDLALAQPREGN